VACYAPRGKGSFPSVLNMTPIPALVSGVPRTIVITPPGPDGKVDPATLLAARYAGITEVYKCGGAQGVAAVAYGTESVPKCLKIVGPGSPWVLAAKRLLADLIDPGIPAGPSESIVLADETADGALAALDLLIESEHGPDSSAFLVTHSRAVADAAREAVPEYWQSMDAQRREFSRSVLTGAAGGIVVTRDFSAAIDFVNDYAPEHLEILAAEPMAVLARIRNAGEVLLGRYTPITLANFMLGPNAVLPTGRHARTRSALSVFDYMKRISVGYVTKDGYAAVAQDAHELATYEGFDAHARAVSPLRRRLLGD
jgi:histidinol dehydrogenase